jgi:hypothetical protein
VKQVGLLPGIVQTIYPSHLLLSWETISFHSLLQNAIGMRGVHHNANMGDGSFERAIMLKHLGKILRQNKWKQTPWS